MGFSCGVSCVGIQKVSVHWGKLSGTSGRICIWQPSNEETMVHGACWRTATWERTASPCPLREKMAFPCTALPLQNTKEPHLELYQSSTQQSSSRVRIQGQPSTSVGLLERQVSVACPSYLLWCDLPNVSFTTAPWCRIHIPTHAQAALFLEVLCTCIDFSTSSFSRSF